MGCRWDQASYGSQQYVALTINGLARHVNGASSVWCSDRRWEIDRSASVCGADQESRVFEDLRDALGVRASWRAAAGSFQWTLCGAEQRAWRVPATSSGDVPAWRLHLRTYAVDGFSGSPAQLSVLSSDLTAPTLAGVVRTADVPAKLELASALDVPGGDFRRVLRAVVVTARSQAAEAGYLSLSRRLTSVGLVPGVDPEAAAHGRELAEFCRGHRREA